MNKPATPPPPHVLVEAEPFIPYMKEENFSPALEPVLAPYKKRMGFLPNALKLYAYRPEIAATLWALNSNIMRDPSSTLDQFLKRKLAVVCCAINGCAYCTAHSCTMLKAPRGVGSEGWGLSEQELQDLITGDMEPANEFERACFDYVRAASPIRPRCRPRSSSGSSSTSPRRRSSSSPAWSGSGSSTTRSTTACTSRSRASC